MSAPQLFEPIDRIGSLDTDQAQREAVRLLQAAQMEAEAIRAEAQAQGFAEGMEAARQNAAPLLEAVSSLVSAAELWQATHEESLAAAAAEVAITAAGRIVEQACEIDPALVAHTLRHALARVHAQERMRIAVNPEDLEFVRASWPELAAEAGAGDAVVVPDPAVSRGGAVLMTSAGELDATVEGQLSELAAAVREAFGA